MEVPLEIRFHNVEVSDALEAAIRERAARLDKLYGRLTSCRVAVEAPHKQHRKGNLYYVTVNMTVPGTELMVNREPHKAQDRYANPDVYKALRDAFDAAERQLLEYKERLSGDTKQHGDRSTSFHGQVATVHPEDDYGFLLTNTGGQLYFHRNSVLNAQLEELKSGDVVHYVEAVGDTGPQASRVWLGTSHKEF
ncbi:HPF/RaiA family ribosome-associated protein [Telmatospirillum sp. J64-1]|uniref:HPF/RaiA family ribosome-associated protein n=1 Tax=Telmatospirillum sp. J64-1 TaxID=2502183 RepID=UPI00115EA24B|nr:HPF/RaiA family ribosome-associated protein [Telmatospirillum sp. J64-1]